MGISEKPTRPGRHHACLKNCTIAVLCLCVAGCSPLMNWHFKRTLDPIQGTITLPGLKEPATIGRDAYGIPYIQTRNMEDMAMAVGYMHASDRLTQMTGIKLISQGRLAEMAGEDALDLDIYMRTINLKQAGQDLYRNLKPEYRALLERYAEGVNAYVARHKDRLPPGLALAGYTPEPWQPADSSTIFALINLSLSFNLHEEIAALAVAQKIGAEKTAWLMPIYPDEPLPLDEAAKLKDLDLREAGQSISGLSDLQPLLAPLGLGGLAASNNWAISKDLSAGKAGILCNDMHLFLSMPSLWNMGHIKCGAYDVAGMSVAGVPAIVAGSNGSVAWGMTMVMADNQDIFLEKLESRQGRLHYLYKGAWLPTSERRETFKIKGKSPITVTVNETVHGPLLNDILRKEPLHAFQARRIEAPYGLALSWAVADKDDDSMNAFFELSSVSSVDRAMPVIRRIRAIPLNMVFADKDNIAWQVIGNYPVRAKGRGLLPSPGWTGEYDWTGLLDTGLLPNAVNPPTGFIATANNRTVPRDFPSMLSSSWYWPERAERICQMASATNRHTAKTCMDMQLDTVSLFVPKLKAVMLGGALADGIRDEIAGWKDMGRKSDAETAMSMLKEFGGDMRADSKVAALISALYECATRNTFLDELGPEDASTWQAFLVLNNESYNATCDHLLVRGDESPFWDDVRTAVHETKAQILARSLAEAAALLRSRLGSDLAKWSWGALHTYTWETDTSKLAPHMGWIKRMGLKALWPYLNRGPYPADGDLFTLNVSAYTMGHDFNTWLIPSMRMIVDFSREEPMQCVNSSGQSDNPSSPHYDDGIQAWLTGAYIAFPFKDAAVKAQYKDVLVLNPSATTHP